MMSIWGKGGNCWGWYWRNYTKHNETRNASVNLKTLQHNHKTKLRLVGLSKQVRLFLYGATSPKSHKAPRSHNPKKWVFKCHLNCTRESHCCSSDSKEFQTHSPAAAKHRSPLSVACVSNDTRQCRISSLQNGTGLFLTTLGPAQGAIARQGPLRHPIRLFLVLSWSSNAADSWSNFSNNMLLPFQLQWPLVSRRLPTKASW